MTGVSGYRGGPGIELISWQQRLPEAQLPEGEIAPPVDGSLQLKLPGVLFQPSLDQALINALEPAIVDRTMLQPERFQAMLDHATDELQTAVTETTSQSIRDALQQARLVLEESSELRQWLQCLRGVLQRA